MGFNKAHKLAQRLHRERRQPEGRKKLGYLEKKKDYKKRAQDHHAKAEKIKKLKNKAQQRNPNEFHFHMINARVVDGVHYDSRKPIDPATKERIVKKEKLLAQYNKRILSKRAQQEREAAISIE